MHEITLCQRALELIEQQAVQNHAKRVTGVWLKVGAFSCVETSALTFCFELVPRHAGGGLRTAYRGAAGGVLVRAVSAVRHAAVIEGTALSAVPEQRAAHRGG